MLKLFMLAKMKGCSQRWKLSKQVFVDVRIRQWLTGGSEDACEDNTSGRVGSRFGIFFQRRLSQIIDQVFQLSKCRHPIPTV